MDKDKNVRCSLYRRASLRYLLLCVSHNQFLECILLPRIKPNTSYYDLIKIDFKQICMSTSKRVQGVEQAKVWLCILPQNLPMTLELTCILRLLNGASADQFSRIVCSPKAQLIFSMEFSGNIKNSEYSWFQFSIWFTVDSEFHILKKMGDLRCHLRSSFISWEFCFLLLLLLFFCF